MSDEYISPRGQTWDEFEKELLAKGYLTPEEKAASEKRVAKMIARIEARNARREAKQQTSTTERAPLEP
jgi:hypothetical protein